MNARRRLAVAALVTAGYDARTTLLLNKERDRMAYFEALAAKYPR